MRTSPLTTLKTFYVLLITQTISMLGSSMTAFAIGVWLFLETGKTTPLMLVAFFSWLPRMVLGGVAGVFADRLNRRMLIMLGDAGQAVPTLLLAIVFATDTFQVWHLYVAALVQSFFGMMQGPAFMASVTMLVPEDHRTRANAIIEISGPLAGMTAPVLGGMLYAVVGITGVIIIDLVTFLLAVGVAWLVHIPQPTRTAESQATQGSVWQELRGGYQFLASRRGLFYVSLYFMFLNFITTGIWRLMTPYMLVLTDSERTVGLLQGISSAGLVIGGLLPIVWQGTRTKIHTIFPTLMWAAVGLIIFGMVRTPLGLGIAVFLMMLPYKFNNALLHSIQQAKIPPDMQGRVYGLIGQISIFAMPITYLVTGPIVDKGLEPAVGGENWHWVDGLVGDQAGAGIGLYIMVCGALLLVASVLVYALPVVRHVERDLPDYKPEPRPEQEASPVGMEQAVAGAV